jgi:hypothetical protein
VYVYSLLNRMRKAFTPLGVAYLRRVYSRIRRAGRGDFRAMDEGRDWTVYAAENISLHWSGTHDDRTSHSPSKEWKRVNCHVLMKR